MEGRSSEYSKDLNGGVGVVFACMCRARAEYLELEKAEVTFCGSRDCPLRTNDYRRHVYHYSRSFYWKLLSEIKTKTLTILHLCPTLVDSSINRERETLAKLTGCPFAQLYQCPE